MSNHISYHDKILVHIIFPQQARFKGEFNWGNDWVTWCERNCEGKFAHNCVPKPNFKTFFLFENKNDAMRFRLIWG